MIKYNNNISNPGDCIKMISNSNMLYIRWDKYRIVVDLNSLQFILKHNNFAANLPDPVRILEVATSHSNSTGGTVAWLLKLQFNMLSTAVLTRNCQNNTLRYQYYSKQEGQEM